MNACTVPIQVLIRRLPLLAALLLGVPAGCADEVEIDTRPCGLQAANRCSYGGGCRHFCSEGAGCLCVSIEKATCDASCLSECVSMANAPINDEYDPNRTACRAAIDQSLAERAGGSK